MIYKKFQDKQLSALGLGCMRFPTIDGKDNQIDMEKTKEMVAYAMQQGINYYDTAYMYHGGQSELVMGEVLKDYPRDSFYLASKFPGFDAQYSDHVEEIFEKQLKKCQVEYFDFYLIHNVCEQGIEYYLNPKYRVRSYLLEQKKNGRIHHLGFSAHAELDTLKRFLEVYGEDMEFCQLQINWVDWEHQNAREKVELVKSYGIPVWVMEPVRGGSLANLRAEFEAPLRALRPNTTNAEWAFRFLQSIPEVVVTLSGMSNLQQLRENIATFAEEKPLSEKEKDALLAIGRVMQGKNAIPCTSCRYCTERCPIGLDIPKMIGVYNERIYTEDGFALTDGLTEGESPSACLGCRACEEVCPQRIKISEMMTDFAEKLKKMSDLEIARERLSSGEFTCVLRKDAQTYASSRRGVKPLVEWLQSGENFQGFSAADKVVGKATAFLYVLLGVKEVYARVVSKSALEVLQKKGVGVEYDTLVENIINRKGDGICPFEAAVLPVKDEKEAYERILTKLKTMQ